jgi:hypothetical protein
MLYLPIIKTRDAELRGLCNLENGVKENISPLFEITRSRSNPKAKNGLTNGPISVKINKLENEYGNNLPLEFDLTSFIDLQNSEITDMFDNTGGFEKWYLFLKGLKPRFPHLIPTLLISNKSIDSEAKYVEVHKQEIETLYKEFSNYIYRTTFDDDMMEFDVDHFFESIMPPIIILDAKYVPKGKGKIYANIATKKLNILYPWATEIILAGSSFPSDPTENNAGSDSGENPLEELIMYRECQKNFPKLVYGDYATIYPGTNERAGGHGWIPRIDFPTENSIVYHRSRKDKGTETDYVPAYTRAARKVIRDDRFIWLQNQIGNTNWGIQQILHAARGYPPGLSPSFWISVRINLHITLRQRLLTS